MIPATTDQLKLAPHHLGLAHVKPLAFTTRELH